MMALKLVSLGRGASGVRWQLVDAARGACSTRGVTPVVPVQGSVGASGDLAPLAHMAAVMLGEGEAEHDGRRLPGAEALAAAGLAPLDARRQGRAGADQRHAVLDRLGARRPLRAPGGRRRTRCWSARCRPTRSWARPRRFARRSTRCAATAARSRPRRRCAAAHGRLGDPREPPRGRHPRPGPLLHPLPAAGDRRGDGPAAPGRGARSRSRRTPPPTTRWCSRTPVVSGGNFHAEPVAFAADIIALAVAEIGAIAQRRVALMVDPTLSYDLPPFLTANPGPQLRLHDRRGDRRRR